MRSFPKITKEIHNQKIHAVWVQAGIKILYQENNFLVVWVQLDSNEDKYAASLTLLSWF